LRCPGRAQGHRLERAYVSDTAPDRQMSFAFLQGVLVAAVFFIPLERLLALHKEQGLLRKGLSLDLTHLLVNGILVTYGVAAVMMLTLLLQGRFIPENWIAAVAAQPIPLQFVEILLIADFMFYAAHRAFHGIPFLWRFHAVHHSIERLDWIAAHRVHPVDQILTKGTSLVLVFALGFEVAAIALYGVFYQWHGLLVHANVRINFGPLRWLLASPQFHHWHHANHPEAIDRNFSPQLPIWDILFGTLYLPDDKMPERYGTDYPIPATYAGQLAHPFLSPTSIASSTAETPRENTSGATVIRAEDRGAPG
jgi:sterol desaturase/sphingolipid hydroxylase (fatty acid hydroxylase superfamily)